MRRRILFTSAQRLVPEGEELVDVVFMWRRRPRMLLYSLAAAVALFLIGLAGLESNVDRIVLAVAAGVVTGMAITEFRVLAQTSTALHLLRAGRLRQVAVEGLDTFPADVEIERIGRSPMFSQWVVDGVAYTVPRSSERSMTRFAGDT